MGLAEGVGVTVRESTIMSRDGTQARHGTGPSQERTCSLCCSHPILTHAALLKRDNDCNIQLVMNRKVFVSAIILVAALVSAFAARPGAYYDAADADEVKAAAEFAVKEEATKTQASMRLKQVLHARKQIVAGTNYRLVILVQKDGRDEQATTLVFRGLDQHYELKTWDWVGGK